jgi:hypothetical protein
VFSPKGIIGINDTTLIMIGVTSNVSENYFLRYIPYLVLLFALAFNSFVLGSEKYDKLMKGYFMKENRES